MPRFSPSNTTDALSEVSSPENRLDSLMSVLGSIHEKYSTISVGQGDRIKNAQDLLEKQISVTETFVAHSRQLLALTTGEDRSHKGFDDAVNKIFAELRFIRDFSSEAYDLIQGLADQASAIKPLLNLEIHLTDTFKPLKLLRLMFLIESANLSDDKKDIFTALTNDIQGLHNDAGKLSRNEFSKFDEVCHSIDSILVDLSQTFEAEKDLAESANSTLNTSLQQLNDDLLVNREKDIQLMELINDISRDTDQLQKSASNSSCAFKRMENVNSAVESILDNYNYQIESNGSAIDQIFFQDIYQQSNVQLDQIQTIISDFEDTHEVFSVKSDLVLDNIGVMARACSDLRDFKLLSSSSDGIVFALLDSYQQISDMVESTVARTKKVYEVLQPYSYINTDITDALQEITKDLRVVVFNAHLKATQTGDGTGLQALTSKVSDISKEANKVSLMIGKKLNEIADGLSKVVGSFDSLSCKGIDKLTSINENLTKTAKDLNEFRSQASGLLDTVTGDTEVIMSVAEDFTSSLNGGFKEANYYQFYRQVLEEIVQVYEDLYEEV